MSNFRIRKKRLNGDLTKSLAREPYLAPPIAAAGAIVPVFRDIIAKSSQQKGQPVAAITLWTGLKEGFKAAPTVGFLVGAQMIFQEGVEKALIKGSNEKNLQSMLISSAIVGTLSSPVIAIFNGQSMGWNWKFSLHKFSAKQGFAIACQETAFVGGITFAERLIIVMKQTFGDNVAVEYTGAFIAGAAGSLAGHPANTAFTRWQNGLKMDSFRQWMWGAAKKARAIGFFSVFFRFGKQILNPTLKEETKI